MHAKILLQIRLDLRRVLKIANLSKSVKRAVQTISEQSPVTGTGQCFNRVSPNGMQEAQGFAELGIPVRSFKMKRSKHCTEQRLSESHYEAQRRDPVRCLMDGKSSSL